VKLTANERQILVLLADRHMTTWELRHATRRSWQGCSVTIRALRNKGLAARNTGNPVRYHITPAGLAVLAAGGVAG
jgi:predicted transcriptional regulator